ncbi:MAG: histone H1 [Bacteroidota bacterium]
MEKYKTLKDLIISVEEDFAKFYDKGNKAAGTRVRKVMQEVKNLSQDIRKEVQEIKNKEDE